MGFLTQPTFAYGTVYLLLAAIVPIFGTINTLRRLQRGERSLAEVGLIVCILAVIFATVIANGQGAGALPLLSLVTMRFAAPVVWLLVALHANRIARTQ